MNFILDIAPALLFLGTYVSLGIYYATGVLIVSMFALVAIYWLRERRVHKMHLFTAIAAAILGGLTLYLRNPEFIKLKPTIVYTVFAAALGLSQLIGGKVLLARIPQNAIVLPDHVWRRVNLAWTLFFAGCAALNLYVANQYSERVWVGFNTIGFTALTFVFMLAHAPFLSRYLSDDTPQ